MPRTSTAKSTPWNRCRCAFRLFRVAILTLVFVLLALLTWLRLFGLPNFLRVQLVDELARRGVVASFRSLHFHWFRGFVADDLRVAWGGTNLPGVQFHIAEADLDVAPPTAWRNRSSLLRGIGIRSASLVVPLPATNEPPVELRIEGITAQVRFLAGDHWEIPRFAARLEGLQLELNASLTNTYAFRRSKPSAKPPDPAARERAFRLARSILRELRTWTADSSAKITAHLEADGVNLPAAHCDLFLEVPSARSPRGDIKGLRLSARVLPAFTPEDPAHLSIVLDLAELQSPNGGLTQAMARAQLSGAPGSLLATNAQWETHVDHLFLRGFRARQANASGTSRFQPHPGSAPGPFETDFKANASQLEIARQSPNVLQIQDANLTGLAQGDLSPPSLSHLQGTLSAQALADPLGTCGPLRAAFDLLQNPTNTPPQPHESLGPWTAAWPFSGTLDLDLSDLRSPKLSVDRFHSTIDWLAPKLSLRKINAALYGGTLQADGDLDILSRLTSLRAESTFDLHGIDNLLGPRSRENFTRYQWKSPPWIQGRASVTLPPWNAKDVDWDAVVKPTVEVHGNLKVAEGSFKGISFDQAASSISFDGTTWRLPDLRTSRPEGRQEIAVEYNEDTREYRIDARGRVIPPVLKPVLGEQSAQIVDLFEFRHAVDADVVVWGPWTEGTRQAIHGTIIATNFTFRSQHFDRLEANVGYTNRFLAAVPVRLTRGSGEATADGVGYDFADDRLWLTNAVNTIEPAVAAAAISPTFPPKLVHYRFANPPRIRANGTLRPKDTDSADMTFSVQGGPFEFWRLRAESVESDLLWKGSTLTLTNISARFFDGTLAGNAFFDLRNPDDSPYRFEAQIRQSEIGKILRHASGGTNFLASGSIDLDLTVTSAQTADIHTWNGFGRAQLRDGLLWDTPIFGFVSPILNAVVPGIGNSRARDAQATFTLTNSVIHTRDLEIDCPPAKLFYRGTLDFDQNVNAKVEAQVLGNFTPMGPLFGLILRPLTKLFEFRTTGTLTDVKAEPLYVPKFLLFPLQPFKFIRGLFNSSDGNSRNSVIHSQPEIPVPNDLAPTNAPPPLPQPPPN